MSLLSVHYISILCVFHCEYLSTFKTNLIPRPREGEEKDLVFPVCACTLLSMLHIRNDVHVVTWSGM